MSENWQERAVRAEAELADLRVEYAGLEQSYNMQVQHGRKSYVEAQRYKAERDQARAQVAKVWALADGWEQTIRVEHPQTLNTSFAVERIRTALGSVELGKVKD